MWFPYDQYVNTCGNVHEAVKLLKKEPSLKFLIMWGKELPFAFCHYPAKFINVEVHREVAIIKYCPEHYVFFGL